MGPEESRTGETTESRGVGEGGARRPELWEPRMARSQGGRGPPVHDGDVGLLVIQKLLPQLLGQQVHTLLLHGPAAGEQERRWAWPPHNPEVSQGAGSRRPSPSAPNPLHMRT